MSILAGSTLVVVRVLNSRRQLLAIFSHKLSRSFIHSFIKYPFTMPSIIKSSKPIINAICKSLTTNHVVVLCCSFLVRFRTS